MAVKKAPRIPKAKALPKATAKASKAGKVRWVLITDGPCQYDRPLDMTGQEQGEKLYLVPPFGYASVAYEQFDVEQIDGRMVGLYRLAS